MTTTSTQPKTAKWMYHKVGIRLLNYRSADDISDAWDVVVPDLLCGLSTETSAVSSYVTCQLASNAVFYWIFTGFQQAGGYECEMPSGFVFQGTSESASTAFQVTLRVRRTANIVAMEPYDS